MPNEDDADVGCDGDLRPDMPEITGRSLLIQDLRNRLETAPGMLAWDPLGADYGYDVRALVNAKVRDPRQIARRIADELEKDERVESADVDVEFSGSTLRIRCRVEDEGGTFEFTLEATELTVEILTQGP